MICIPPKNTERCVMNLFNTETGENLGQIENIQEVNITSEFKTDYARDKDNNKVLSFQHNPTRTMTFSTNESMDTKKFYDVLGVDTGKMPDAYDIQYIKFVQARKHKKRRINKKWLKRYGYKQVVVDCKGWKMKHYIDGTIEFVK